MESKSKFGFTDSPQELGSSWRKLQSRKRADRSAYQHGAVRKKVVPVKFELPTQNFESSLETQLHAGTRPIRQPAADFSRHLSKRSTVSSAARSTDTICGDAPPPRRDPISRNSEAFH